MEQNPQHRETSAKTSESIDRETTIGQATVLLHRVGDGDDEAVEPLFSLVYEDLRAIAGSYFRRERADHTLQPTALVHEAFIKLIRPSDASFKSQAHFLVVAANVMRQILTDHARARATAKRGGGAGRVGLEQIHTPSGDRVFDVVELDEALKRLSGVDEKSARVVEMWFFGGMTTEQIAEVLKISSRTVKRIWRQCRAWLYTELGGEVQT